MNPWLIPLPPFPCPSSFQPLQAPSSCYCEPAR
jgi:hypothetical protein